MTGIVAFKLTSTATVASAPFAVGQGFRRGDVPSGQYLVTNLANTVVTPLCYWNDGSVKHAVVMGRANVSPTPLQVSVSSTSSAPTAGTALTAASLAASGAAVTVAVTGVGTVDLSSLLATPVRTHISNSEMVECHYSSSVGTDPHLYVWVYSRLYANGQREHEVVLGNGHLGGGPTKRDFAVTITIEGTVAFTSAAYHLSPWAQLDAYGWSGVDPQITPQHDTGYLVRTKLVPNYWKFGTPTAGQIGYLNSISTYTPGANLGHSETMGGTGYQDGIGLLPRWDGMYIETLGSKVAFNAVIANARAINSYAISFPDSSNHGPIKITDYPTWSVFGAGQGGTYGIPTIKQDNVNYISHEKAHASQGGYLAYLLTARMRFFDSLQNQARAVFLMEDINGGSGVNRVFKSQNRARGWGYRTMALAAALIPTSLATRYGDIKAWMAGMSAANVTKYAGLSTFQKSLGMEDAYFNRGSPAPDGESVLGVGMFEHFFVAQSMGMALQVEPCDSSGMSSVSAFADHMLGAAIWPLGVSQIGSTDHPFPYASSYQHNIPSDGGTAISGVTATTYGQIYTATFSTAPDALVYNPGGNALVGNSGGDPTISTGYWANLLPAIALAVEAGKTGAAAAFSRLTSASNWSYQVNAGYDDVPNFAVVPASYAQQPIQFVPVDSGGGGVVSSAGPSIRCEPLPLHTQGFILTKQPGIGTPGSQIAGSVSGADGTTPIRDAVIAAGGNFNPLSEYRVVPVAGIHGTLFVDDVDLSEIYSGDGAYDPITTSTYEDGAFLSTTFQNFGTAPAGDTNPPTMVGALTVSGISTTSYTVSWSPATDNIGVVSYELSNDGGVVYANVGNALSFTKTGQTPGQTYPLRVRAVDAANNKSAALSATVTTNQVTSFASTVTFAVVDSNGNAVNASGLDYAFYDRPRISAGTAPVKYGSDLLIINGVATINITGTTTLLPGQTGRIEWGDANGTKHGGGPVTVT